MARSLDCIEEYMFNIVEGACWNLSQMKHLELPVSQISKATVKAYADL